MDEKKILLRILTDAAAILKKDDKCIMLNTEKIFNFS